jgi:DNA-binding transcriptional LysR family regulator
VHDLALIRAFDALYEYQSLTLAAKILKQPKSTLSRRIAQLETELGQALFIRKGNRLVITQAGIVFSIYSKQFIDLANKSVDALQNLNNEISGQLNIVAHTSLIRGWLNTAIDDFLQRHPKISIRLVSQYQPDLLDVIPDIIFWVGEIDGVDWHNNVLGQWHCTPFASPKYLEQSMPLTHPNDISEHQWIDYSTTRHDCIRLYHPKLGDCLIEPTKTRLYSDNQTLQLDAIVNGQGIGLLPIGLANGYSRFHPDKLIACLPGWKTAPININCYVSRERLPLRVTEFLRQVHTKQPIDWSLN